MERCPVTYSSTVTGEELILKQTYHIQDGVLLLCSYVI